jgi:GNAT superfamily N-acetyltransferase
MAQHVRRISNATAGYSCIYVIDRPNWERRPDKTMMRESYGIPTGWRLDLDVAPSAETRATLAREINAFHSRTVPHEAQRFAVLLRDDKDQLAAGIVGVISWKWLFIEAAWVDDSLRGQGVGRTLLTKAEDHAVALGCHSAWLDTFQARDFYLTLGYAIFGVLEDYPPGQSRYFMKKRLGVAAGP